MKSAEDGLLISRVIKSSVKSKETIRKCSEVNSQYSIANKEDETLSKLNKAFIDNESKKREPNPRSNVEKDDKKKKSNYLKICVIVLLSVSQVSNKLLLNFFYAFLDWCSLLLYKSFRVTRLNR